VQSTRNRNGKQRLEALQYQQDYSVVVTRHYRATGKQSDQIKQTIKYHFNASELQNNHQNRAMDMHARRTRFIYKIA